ncbi:MAG: pro-sigmaK processing inhibitor BofA family protein [Candidatus Micrarchaeota archaeon]|nr:pro-sigmaK processing inhibitor BofA family protein [Candidatus Micrarchaeota archaeon]
MAVPIVGGILSEVVLLIGIFLVLYIIFKLGKFILGLLINVVLGFISIFVLNAVFGLGITLGLISIVVIALLGLPGAAIIVILKLLGISL